MFLIWDGDILTLYALIGLCIIPLSALDWRWQLFASLLALIVLSYLPAFNQALREPPIMLRHGITATRVYGKGSFGDSFHFRLLEKNRFIVPLILHIVPKISALIICGMALWISGLFSKVKDFKSERWYMRALAATGQMALTNYLAESIIFTIMFYGSGFGLFAKLSSSETLLICTLLFTGQMIFSEQWLRYFEFGPAEWLWRSLTYGKRFSFRRSGKRL